MIAQVAAALVFFAGEGVDPAVAAATLAAVKEQLSRGGAAPADLSAEHRALFTPSLFVDFTAAAPAFLPPELAAPWRRGSEACARRVGPTGPEVEQLTRAAAAAEAQSCRESLALAMWDLFLESRKVMRVVELELRAAGGLNGLTAALYEPAVPRRRALKVDRVNPDRTEAASVTAVANLLAGTGAEGRVTRHLLPSLGVPGLDAVPLGTPKPVAVPSPCRGLPSRLEIFPLGKLTGTMEAAYLTIPAKQRTGKPLRCDLVLWPPDIPPAEPMVFARFQCPPVQVRWPGAVNEAPELLHALVERMASALCAERTK